MLSVIYGQIISHHSDTVGLSAAMLSTIYKVPDLEKRWLVSSSFCCSVFVLNTTTSTAANPVAEHFLYLATEAERKNETRERNTVVR